MSEKNIYQRINSVMKKVEYVKKDAVVQGYKAVTHDMVVAQVRKHFVTEGIVLTCDLVKDKLDDREYKTFEDGKTIPDKQRIYRAVFRVSFINIDNPEDRIDLKVPAHAMDTGDKNPGKAMSYATKFAILKTLSLESGENDESRTTEKPVITEEQVTEIETLLATKDKPDTWRARLLKAQNVPSIEEILAPNFKQIIKLLKGE